MTFPPTPPAPKRRLGPIILTIGLGLAVVMLLCCGVGTVLYLVGKTAPPPAAAAGSPSPNVPTTAASATGPPATTMTTPGPDYAGAARILQAGNQHYRDAFAAGQAALGSGAFPSWYQGVTADQRCQEDRLKASALVPATAQNTVITWFEDCIELSSHINQWGYAAGAAPAGTITDPMKTYAARVPADLVVVEQDAAAVAALG